MTDTTTPQEALAEALRLTTTALFNPQDDRLRMADRVLAALPEGWRLIGPQESAAARALGAAEERKRLRTAFGDYWDWLIKQPLYGNGGGWGEAAMVKFSSLLAEPEEAPRG